jgi:hypothetical protein
MQDLVILYNQNILSSIKNGNQAKRSEQANEGHKSNITSSLFRVSVLKYAFVELWFSNS